MTESGTNPILTKASAILRTETVGIPNLLWGILVIAFVLRCIELTEDSIWIDEAFAIMTARLDFEPLMTQIFADGLTPPLHYLLLSVWINAFGDSEIAARSLSVGFGVLSVWLIYRLGDTLAGRRVALISACVLALSSFHVHYAQEARTYTLLVCLSIASYWFLFKWLQQNKARNALLYVLMSSLMIYAHFFGLFVVLAQNIYVASLLLFKDRDAGRLFWTWCGVQLLLILSVLPLALLLMAGLQRVDRGVWIADTFPPTFQSLFELLSAFAGSPAGLAFCALLFGWAVFVWGRGRPTWTSVTRLLVSPTGLLLGWLIIGVGAPFLVSVVAQPILFPRYVIYASVPFFILLAMSIERFYLNSMIYKGLIATLVILGCVQLTGFYLWNWNHFRFLRDWRSAELYIDQTAAPSDLILCTGNCQGLSYYLRDSSVAFRLSPRDLRDESTGGAATARFLSDLEAYERVFYVRPRRLSDAETVIAALQQDFAARDRKKVKGLFIDTFERAANDP